MRWSSRASASARALEIDAPVYTVASHDTASAFAATPVRDGAILSSGTWSLLGLELPGPVFTDER